MNFRSSNDWKGWLIGGISFSVIFVSFIWIVHVWSEVPFSPLSTFLALLASLCVNVPAYLLIKNDVARDPSGTSYRLLISISCMLAANVAIMIHVLTKDGILVRKFEPLLLGSTFLVNIFAVLIGIGARRARL